MNYFDKLPTISYDNYVVKNILARSKLSDQTKNDSNIFYPYTIQHQMRVDQLSNKYYDDPGYTWLVWYANDVIDPYFDYPLSDVDFERFVEDKYGSLESALRRIYYYRVDWVGESAVLTTTQFNALPGTHKKYYDPVINGDLSLVGYERKREDEQVGTNKIISLTATMANSSILFTVGEEVQINPSIYSFCTQANTTHVVVNHVNGTFAANSTITGMTSGATANITLATTISSTIADTDAIFWTPVTYYEYENEKNEQKKEIQLIDIRHAGELDEELKRSMNT